MIVDRFENLLSYEKLLPNLAAGVAKVKELKNPEVGRYEFDGGYLMVQKGATKPIEECSFEVHRNYIDVQILLDGCEELGWQPLAALTPSVPYDAQRDIEFLNGGRDNVLLVSAGLFYAVYPEDGHMPSCHTKEQHPYTKIVMKLPVQAQ